MIKKISIIIFISTSFLFSQTIQSPLEKNNLSDKVAIQLDHFSDGTKLILPFFLYYSNQDTIVTVNDFRSVVKSLYEVKRPKGYLIPRDDLKLKQWMDNHNLEYYSADSQSLKNFEEYIIDSIGTIDFERHQ